MKKIVILLLFTVLSGIITAQQKQEVLMYINQKPVSVQEFENLYTKNLDMVQDPAQKDIDNYLKLFTNYKLELEDAYQKKYDTLPYLVKELKKYRNDLAGKYKTDEEIIDKLVEEAYKRKQQDVKVSHILIQVPPNASPADTLKAYNKIMKIYNQAVSGADFKKLAEQYSQDPSVKENKGDLGYINVFTTVYPFETAAYNTPVGKVSKPFRTRFGYHIVKAEDKRPARGEVEVAHIMTFDKKDKDGKIIESEQDAKTRIFDIYGKLKEGKDTFENLAKKYSDDKNSARFGGKLRRFGIRQMVPEFEKHSFALQNEGDISEPFQTRYGWHIVKLLKKYPVPPYEKAKIELKNKILRSDRAQMGKEKLLQQIEKQFPVSMKGSLQEVYKLIDENFFQNKWKIPQSPLNRQTLFEIDGKEKVTYQDFFEYLYKRQQHNPANFKNKKQVIDKLFENFKKDKLFTYYMNHLEEIYPDFANTMKEYKNGLLLFYIKSDMVWNKAAKDTLGQKEFFNRHRHQYRSPKKYKVLMVQTNDAKSAAKIVKYLKKGKDKKYLKSKFKNLIVKEKTFSHQDPFIRKHDLEQNKITSYRDGDQYMVIKLLEVIPEKEAEFKDVAGKVITDYQNYLEEEWLKEIREKYPVQLNEKNWKKIRAKYKK